jgi:uncharacterized damage-inducible protein DinB
MLSYLQKLFAYNHWATAEAISSLRAAVSPPDRALKIAAHVLGAEWLWLARLRNEPPPVPVWPEWALDDMQNAMDGLRGEWNCYFAGLAENGLSRDVAYVNTKGETWSNTVQDILTHVTIHSAYHRGQVATKLREAGHEQAYTDFIHCVRQGLLH